MARAPRAPRCCASVWGCAQCVPAACHAAETRCPGPGGSEKVWGGTSMRCPWKSWNFGTLGLVRWFIGELFWVFEFIWINLNPTTMALDHWQRSAMVPWCRGAVPQWAVLHSLQQWPSLSFRWVSEASFGGFSGGFSRNPPLCLATSSEGRGEEFEAVQSSAYPQVPKYHICPRKQHITTGGSSQHVNTSSYFINFHGCSGSSKAQTPRFSITKQHDFLCSCSAKQSLPEENLDRWAAFLEGEDSSVMGEVLLRKRWWCSYLARAQHGKNGLGCRSPNELWDDWAKFSIVFPHVQRDFSAKSSMIFLPFSPHE